MTKAEYDQLYGNLANSPYVDSLDPDASWDRPQVRVYQIIGLDGEPTGKLAYADSEVKAAALTQEVRDVNGTVYLPSARLVDIDYSRR